MECTPENLADLATCFVDLSQGQRDAMLTYLVAVLGGVPVTNCDFNNDFNNDFCNT